MRTLTASIAAVAMMITATSFTVPASAASISDRQAQLERRAGFVEDIQEALYTLGYLGLDDIDGSFGARTAIAIRRFETDHGLVRSGAATPELRQLLIDMAFPDLPANPELLGAVSMPDDFREGAAYGRYTLEVAKAIAIRRCLQNSRTKRYCDEHVIVGAGIDWLVTMVCGRVYVSAKGATKAEAEREAVATAREGGSRSHCSNVHTANATFGEFIDTEEEQLLARPVDEPPAARALTNSDI